MARNSGIPHYLRIADALAARLATESAGWRLPSVQALARKEKVALNTANRALAELRRRGLVVSRRGSGTYSLGRTGPVVRVFGYLVDLPHFAAFFRSLTERLARQGLRTVLTETGLHGEALGDSFRLSEVATSAMVLWVSPSHPEGVRLCTLARRRLPVRLPLVLVADPLGLDLEGGHRFDFLHWDATQGVRKLLGGLTRTRLERMVWIQRSDIETVVQKEARSAFLAALVEAGVSRPLEHIVDWDVERRGSLAAAFAQLKGWRPEAVMLQCDYEVMFRAACREQKIELSANLSVLALGRGESHQQALAAWRDLARTCSDLVFSRLSDPGRPNLKVAIAPPRRRSAKGETGL